MRWGLVGLLLPLAGCATVGRGPGPVALQLAEGDKAFAAALAHYGWGILCEAEYGLGAAATAEQYRKAAELDPGEHRLHSKAASVALRQGRGDDAVAMLEASCRASPRSVRARLDLARACQVLGRFDDAIRHYRRALQLGSDQPYIHVTVVRLLFLRDRDEDALEALRDGLAQPRSLGPLVAYCRGQARDFLVTGASDRALRCYRFLAAHAPEGRARYCHLAAELLQEAGDEEEAVRYLTEATEAPDPLPDSFVRLALIEARSDASGALRRLRQAGERMPDEPLILLTMAHLHGLLGQFDQAVPIYARIETLTAGSETTEIKPAFYLNYGSACERAGQYAKAEQVFEACLAKYPDAAQVLNYLAYMWAERGEKLDRALEYVRRALAQEPENAAYLDTLGWIYFRQGRFADALVELRKAFQIMGDDAVIAEHVGDCHLALGDTAQAVSFWRQSFLLDPASARVAGKLLEHGVDVSALRKEARRQGRDPATPPAPATAETAPSR